MSKLSRHLLSAYLAANNRTFSYLVLPKRSGLPSLLLQMSASVQPSRFSSTLAVPNREIDQRRQRQNDDDDDDGREENNRSIVVSLKKKMSLRRSNDYRDLKKLLSNSGGNSQENGGQLEISIDIRERFYELCAGFLGGAWKFITANDMRVTHIKGGMTNMLFLCELPENVQPCGDESDKTLLRIYFNPETENRLVAESVIFTLLSERHLGPKLYGVFNEGRLEEFIVSSTLCTSDIWQPDISRLIAQKLAKMHKMSLPIGKEPTYMFEAIERWLEQLTRLCPDVTVSFKHTDSTTQDTVVTLNDLIKEYHLVKKALKRSNSPIAFCHNDLQEGNILLPLDANSSSKDLVIIDFEYASYNYRAFDIANHFSEWAIDYSFGSPPYFKITLNDFPTIEQQKNFLHAYLLGNNDDCSEKSINRFVHEVQPFIPMPHFFWGVWSLVQKELSPVNFGFGEYAKQRLNIYFNHREQLLSLLNN